MWFSVDKTNNFSFAKNTIEKLELVSNKPMRSAQNMLCFYSALFVCFSTKVAVNNVNINHFGRWNEPLEYIYASGHDHFLFNFSTVVSVSVNFNWRPTRQQQQKKTENSPFFTSTVVITYHFCDIYGVCTWSILTDFRQKIMCLPFSHKPKKYAIADDNNISIMQKKILLNIFIE